MKCEYGCGQEAKYQLKNGKWICSTHSSSCPAKRIINSDSKRKNNRKNKREKPELCDYGCGQKAKYYFKYVNKWCCSSSNNKCPKNREKNSLGLKESYQKNNKITPKNFSIESKIKMGNKSAETRMKKLSQLSWDDSPLSEKLRRVLKEQDNKCYICKIDSWNEKQIILQIHHVDGDSFNNKERNNLQFLCPNCHSQTKNFTSKNKSKKKYVSDDEFIKALKESVSVRQALIKLNLSGSGNYNRAYNLLNRSENKINDEK